MDERVCVFIDGPNLFHSAKAIDVKVDYVKLKEVLVANRFLIRPYFYCSTAETPEQNRFFDKLRYLGYEVKTLPLRQYDGIPFEKGVDVMLVTDMLVLAHKDAYDTAILVAGDKDYTYSMKAVKEMGKRVEVASFDPSFAKELRLSADRSISLTESVDKIKMSCKVA
jgi:uncharacterized LabA/DUF88 family protein